MPVSAGLFRRCRYARLALSDEGMLTSLSGPHLLVQRRENSRSRIRNALSHWTQNKLLGGMDFITAQIPRVDFKCESEEIGKPLANRQAVERRSTRQGPYTNAPVVTNCKRSAGVSRMYGTNSLADREIGRVLSVNRPEGPFSVPPNNWMKHVRNNLSAGAL